MAVIAHGTRTLLSWNRLAQFSCHDLNDRSQRSERLYYQWDGELTGERKLMTNKLTTLSILHSLNILRATAGVSHQRNIDETFKSFKNFEPSGTNDLGFERFEAAGYQAFAQPA
jgi:hypothetical protein